MICGSDAFPVVLAHDFDILKGKAKVDIPLVVEGEYQVVCESSSAFDSTTS